MFPYSSKGRNRCEPKHLVAVVDTLSTCFRISSEQIAAKTTINAFHFFQLSKVFQSIETVANSVVIDKKKLPHKNKQIIQDSAIMNRMDVDGSKLEGGDQILRISFPLALILKKYLHAHSIRANRPSPGLKRQYLCNIEISSKISGGKLIGAELNSTWVDYIPFLPFAAG